MRLVDQAIAYAKGGIKRNYMLAAVGIRSDGVVVFARNGPSRAPCLYAHAEARLTRKLTPGSTVYVVRVMRSGGIGLAKPCGGCQKLLAAKGVCDVYHSLYSDPDHPQMQKSKGKLK